MIRGTGRWICVAGCAPCSSAPVLGAGSSAHMMSVHDRKHELCISCQRAPVVLLAESLLPTAGTDPPHTVTTPSELELEAGPQARR